MLLINSIHVNISILCFKKMFIKVYKNDIITVIHKCIKKLNFLNFKSLNADFNINCCF